MYDRYLIVDDSLRNVPSGFEFDVRVAYYRSVALSMVDALEVDVDGVPLPSAAISFVLRGTPYRLDELDEESETRWEFGEIASVRVDRHDALPRGEHSIGFTELLRIIYMPGGILRGRDVKTLEISET
jgi:hypothetical protein